MYAVNGKVLEIDLTTGESREIGIKEEEYRKYLGGTAMACHLTGERMAKVQDPLGPDNLLSFMTGPFTGSGVSSEGRHAVTALSPLTGCWGEATGGGLLARNLKGCGYDGIIITGKAEKPVYLYLGEGGWEIKDASHLWGGTTHRTVEGIREETTRNTQVAAIGPAGENLVRYACVVCSGGGVAGRCGLGAVMGSKNLKAVAFRGRRLPYLANPGPFEYASGEVYKELEFKGDLLKEYGTLGYIDVGTSFGDVPDRYFTSGLFPVEKVSASTLRRHYVVESSACCYCALSCKKTVHLEEKEKLRAPEYETAVSLGPLLGIYDLEFLCRINRECNDLGVDTISVGVSLGFAAHLQEEGLVPAGEEGIAPFAFGDQRSTRELLQKISRREGEGDLLAEGVRRMAEKLEVDPGLAAHAKGLEIPMHEPRAFEGQALCYATGPRGACHQRGDFYMVDLGQFDDPGEMGFYPGDRFTVEGRIQQVIHMQDYRELFNNLLLCNYAMLPLQVITGLLGAVTGWDLTPEEVLESGRRSSDLKRALNCELGVTPAGDRLPEIVCRPLPDGGAAGKELYLEQQLQEYYRLREWDPQTGRPQKEC